MPIWWLIGCFDNQIRYYRFFSPLFWTDTCQLHRGAEPFPEFSACLPPLPCPSDPSQPPTPERIRPTSGPRLGLARQTQEPDWGSARSRLPSLFWAKRAPRASRMPRASCSSKRNLAQRYRSPALQNNSPFFIPVWKSTLRFVLLTLNMQDIMQRVSW